jgi:hypothetical protein
MTQVTMQVTIDMDDFDDDRLIKEVIKRGYKVWDEEERDAELTRIYEALYLGKQEEAMQRTREYVCNVLGRVL